jgi:membrane protease YdiL (CAAX protease family)
VTANGFEPEPDRVPPLGLIGSAALFGAGALLLFLTTRVAVPAFVSATGAETVVIWFLAASIVGGLAAVGVLTGGIGSLLRVLQAEKGLYPSFMAFEPLSPGRYWIIGVWLPFFVLNIVGEELAWRGLALPRQEVAFGRQA